MNGLKNKRPKKIFLIAPWLSLVLLFSANTVSAQSNVSNTKYKFGLGFGLQYSGFIGTQFNLINGNHKGYLSVGFLGLGAGFGGGYDYAVSNNVSVGVNYSGLFIVFAESYITSLNANYHFGSTFNKGWTLGIDAGRRSGRNLLSGDSRSDAVAFFSVGYRF